MNKNNVAFINGLLFKLNIKTFKTNYKTININLLLGKGVSMNVKNMLTMVKYNLINSYFLQSSTKIKIIKR